MSRPPIHVVPPRPRTDPSPAESEDRRAADLARVGRFIAKLQDALFFGKVTISVQSGKVTDVRIEQTVRLDEL